MSVLIKQLFTNSSEHTFLQPLFRFNSLYQMLFLTIFNLINHFNIVLFVKLHFDKHILAQFDIENPINNAFFLIDVMILSFLLKKSCGKGVGKLLKVLFLFCKLGVVIYTYLTALRLNQVKK